MKRAIATLTAVAAVILIGLLAPPAHAQVPIYTRPNAQITNVNVNAPSVVTDSVVIDRANQDVILLRDAGNTLAQKNGTNAQVNRLYFSTTGPVYFQQTARTAGALYTAVGGAAQVSYAQTTAPTCTTNCGTGSPTVAGTDTAGIITLGTTPASGFQVNFNGTWPSAPSCIVQSALATMVVGKIPIAVVPSTTNFVVTTNGTAPSTGDKYQYHCIGVS